MAVRTTFYMYVHVAVIITAETNEHPLAFPKLPGLTGALAGDEISALLLLYSRLPPSVFLAG